MAAVNAGTVTGLSIGSAGYKTSELPLNAQQRSSIDNLVYSIKKKGEFDSARKSVWAEFTESNAKNELATALAELVEAETDREPSLLSRDRGKAATLIQGAVDRSNVYKEVEVKLDLLISAHLNNVETVAREIRRMEVGEQQASDEQKLGAKTDTQYEAEIAEKRHERALQRKKEAAKKKREAELARVKAEFEKKALELERLKKRTERQKEDAARAAKRQAERQKHQEEQRKLYEQERAKKLAEDERKAKEREQEEKERQERDARRGTEGRDRSWDRFRSRSRSRDRDRHRRRDASRSHERRMPRSRSPRRLPSLDLEPKKQLSEKEIEDIALEALLKEGRELADKSKGTADRSRAGSDDPPARRPPTGPRALDRGDRAGTRLSELHSRGRDDSREPDSKGRHRSHSRRRSISRDHPTARRENYRLREMDAEAYKQNLRRDRSRSYDRRRSRSRSPNGRRYDRERDRSSRGDRQRGKSPVEIDRYMPSTSSRRHDRDERERDRHRDRPRDRDRDRDRDRERDRDRDGDRRQRRERSREGGREVNRDTDRTRGTGRARSPTDIDRYIPSAALRRRERSRSRTRG